MKTIEIKGKSGQVKDGKKLTGGIAYNLKVPGEEVQRLTEGLLDLLPAKLGAMLFSYGLTAKAQEATGYSIPGAVKGGDTAPVHEWTAEDTDVYLSAVRSYDELENNRAGGINTVELRGFFRAMSLAGFDYDASLAKAQEAKIKHSDDPETAARVWAKAQEL